MFAAVILIGLLGSLFILVEADKKVRIASIATATCPLRYMIIYIIFIIYKPWLLGVYNKINIGTKSKVRKFTIKAEERGVH